MKRIRYIKDSSGNYITQGNVRSETGQEFRCGFTADGKNGFVKPLDEDIRPVTLQASSPHKMKIKIKKTLAKFGCTFSKEERKKRNEADTTATT